MSKASGFWTCFNCRGSKRHPVTGNVFPMRKLEIRQVNPHAKKKKKGKVVREAMVCQACYDEGFNKVPVGFNGYIMYAPQLPENIMKMLREQKAEAETKVEKAKELGVA